jgi:uncharacterized membrane protein
MAWIGLIGGILVGAVGWGWDGAVVAGFVGWLAGIIAGSRKKPSKEPVVVKVQETTATRLARLEKRVAELEARLEEKWGRTPITEIGVRPHLAEEPPPIPEPVGASVDDAPPPLPPEPPTPAKPNPLIGWFTGANAFVRIGALIFFVGLVFLLNYAREHAQIPPELRIAGVALVAIALLVVGWRLRARRSEYALSLQGAGIAVLYLTIFAAMRLYGLISNEAAFLLLAAVAVFSAFLAIAQDSLALAVIGAGGGFLAPILASSGSGNHVVLFGYYLVLNLGIVAIAWFKAWRPLNVVGFVFTVLIGLAWGERHYTAELYASTQAFLIAFFLLYVVIAILFARASSSRTLPSGSNGPGSKAIVDGTIVFGAPLAAFGMQAGLMKGTELGLAFSSIAAAILYIALASVLHRRQSERWALLALSFLSLGVVFATLAIPLALDARWTSAAWALEGAAIVWIGLKQNRPIARAFGLLLQIGAGVAYIEAYRRMPAGVPLADAPFIGAVLVGFAGLWTHYCLSRPDNATTAVERSLAPVLFVWGLGWWLFAGHHEIESYLPRQMRLNAHAAFFAGTAIGFAILAHIASWREARWPALVLLPTLCVVGLIGFLTQSHPFASYGWIVWPLVIAAQAWLLRRMEAGGERSDRLATLHTGLFLLIAALGAWEMHWLAAHATARATAWSVSAVLIIPALLVLLVTSRAIEARWPVAAQPVAYRVHGVFIVLLAMGAWSLYANATHDGRSDPLPYLPLLNAIDLGHILVAICLASAVLAWRRNPLGAPASMQSRNAAIVVGALAFVWLNAILLRTLHHWADVPFRVDAMIRSVLVQASLSIFWAVIALALMVHATRGARRREWVTGAALMGVVVVKLVAVDLSHLGGIERIVAFIAVGVLMLVVGYFSPMPPRKAEAVA